MEMTELEKLIEQKKEIERRIKELKEQPRCFGEGEVIKVDKYRRCAGAKEMFRVSAKRMSYNEVTDGRYIALIDVPMEDKDEAIEYLAMIVLGLEEYFKENKAGDDEIPKDYSAKLTPVGFSQHDCESHYECPFCGEHYGSWSIPINKPFKCKCGKYVWTD